jgi:Tol biopolymer transport system component
MRNKLLYLFFTLAITNACSQNIENGRIGSFDISKDDKTIIFSYYNKNIASLYTANIDGSNIKQLIFLGDSLSSVNPKYSFNGDKIVYLVHKINCVNGNVFIANSDGTNVQQLTYGNQIITEAIFSINDKEIYYCKANEFDRYSQIGIKNAHNFDIYSINLIDKMISRLSYLKSYGINSISDIDEKCLLMRIEEGPNSGMYLFFKEDSSKFKRIVPINNPRNNASYYYTPIYSDTLKTIVFTAPYEIYMMSLKDKIAKLIYSNIGSYDLSQVVFYKKQPKILFLSAENSNLYSINIDGTSLTTIPIFSK